MHLSDRLKRYINGPHGMNMGTRDANLKPEYHRVLGARVVDDNHVHIYIDKNSAGRTFQNLEDNQQMTVVMCSLENFESFQLKGKSVNWRVTNEEEDQFIAEYFNKTDILLQLMGFPAGVVRNYPHSSMLTLLMEVEEVYEQTPKVGTGQKVAM